MIPAALLLVLLLIVGYVADQEHRKRKAAEAIAAHQAADLADLQQTIDDQTDTAAANAERIAELEGTVAWLRERVDLANDAALDLDRLLTAERARTEIHETALRGLLDHQARVDLVAPDEPVGTVQVIAETTTSRWVPQAAGVAPVVPLRGLSADEADDLHREDA